MYVYITLGNSILRGVTLSIDGYILILRTVRQEKEAITVHTLTSLLEMNSRTPERQTRRLLLLYCVAETNLWQFALVLGIFGDLSLKSCNHESYQVV